MKISKDNLVITIDSELGSRGVDVAKELSKELKIPCYSGEIINEATRLSGISEKLLLRYEERPVRAAYDFTAEDESAIVMPPARDFITAQVAACREIAERGSCILVDHHATMALADKTNCVSIFVHADFDSRAEVYAGEMHIDAKEARAELKKADRMRSRYYKGCSKHWGEAGNYELTVNSSGVEPSVLAKNIIYYLETVSQETLIHPTRAQKRGA